MKAKTFFVHLEAAKSRLTRSRLESDAVRVSLAPVVYYPMSRGKLPKAAGLKNRIDHVIITCILDYRTSASQSVPSKVAANAFYESYSGVSQC